MPLRQFQLSQEAAGAHFPDPEQDYPQAAHYGNPEKEYQAAQQSAALFDLSDRDQIELTGADRHKFLHNFCTNDIQGLAVDEGCEAFVTNVQSRILGYIQVFNQGESLWIDTAPGQSEAITNHLDRYIILEDARLIIRTPEFGSLYLTGPQAGDMLDKLGVKPLEVNQQQQMTDSDSKLTVRRVDWFGQPGYLCSLQYVKIAEFWQALIDQGAVPSGQEVFDALRIESRYPIYGVDLSDSNLAQEASRTSQAISFKKGCYLGQEPIARIDSLGHVNQEVRVIALEQDWLPPQGAKVMVGSGDDTKEVGQITSAARSFGKYPVVAMGVIRRGVNEPESVVDIVSNGERGKGTVYLSIE